MRRILCSLVLVVAIWIGAGSGARFLSNELQASPATCGSIDLPGQHDCNAVLITVNPAWEIPATATVPEVSFEITPGVRSAYLAELIKPPENLSNSQATSNYIYLD